MAKQASAKYHEVITPDYERLDGCVAAVRGAAGDQGGARGGVQLMHSSSSPDRYHTPITRYSQAGRPLSTAAGLCRRFSRGRTIIAELLQARSIRSVVPIR